MKRKPVQIAAVQFIHAAAPNMWPTLSINKSLFALCDDGSLWELDRDEETWKRIPDIPPDNPNDPVMLRQQAA